MEICLNVVCVCARARIGKSGSLLCLGMGVTVRVWLYTVVEYNLTIMTFLVGVYEEFDRHTLHSLNLAS